MDGFTLLLMAVVILLMAVGSYLDRGNERGYRETGSDVIPLNERLRRRVEAARGVIREQSD
jgi:hypothetical protein